MTGRLSRRPCGREFVLILLAGVLLVSTPPTKVQTAGVGTPDTQTEIARQMVRRSGSSGGICAVVAPADADLAMALAGQDRFTVQCLTEQSPQCDALRQAIRSRGVYGGVSADTLRPRQLPYVDNLVNIVVVPSYPALRQRGLSPAEVFRVLAPLGTAFVGNGEGDDGQETEALTAELQSAGFADVAAMDLGGRWICAKKPWPANIDQWTHYLHAADGNPVARDSVVGPPQHYQWISDPVWLRSHESDSSVQTLVTANGRLFAIVDEAPISLAGAHSPPDRWMLVARDAFNGVLLWKVPIEPWGWREWRGSWFSTRPNDIPLNVQKRLVAVGDRVYATLGYHSPVVQLDARTGGVLQTYAGTEQTGEILYHDGALILSALAGRQVRVMAVDAASGRRLWVSDNAYGGSTTDYIRWKEMNGGIEPPVLDPSLNTATDGRTVALIDGSEIVGLDFATGRQRWRARFPQDDADQTAGGMRSQGELWIGTMIVCDGVVLHATPNRLGALSAESGEVLWVRPKKYIGHLWYEWKDVFVIDGLVWTWSDELEVSVISSPNTPKPQRSLSPKSVNAYDLHTGELKSEVPLGPIFKANHHHRCYRNKATLRYILASRRGTEFVDLKDGRHTVDNWVRGTCHVGMMPANGLQYAPPHPCQCYIDEKLNGMNVLAPANETDREPQPAETSPRLERGPAYDEKPTLLTESGPAADADWPAFRHDAMRSGAVDTRVADDAAPLWRVAVGGKISPPIVVGDRLFAAAIDEHHVVCLDTQTGEKVWEFAAGGRIDSPPTYHAGTILLGSADGYVYCLRADDGRLVWRFRAAPRQRLIGAFGQLESAWPVHGSVLVQNGAVFFAAGRTSQLDGGMYLFALDPATGEVLHEVNIAGPRYTADNFEVNFQLPMGSLPDVLLGDGEGALYMRANAFDQQLNRQTGMPPLRTGGGLLDDSYFKRIPWIYEGAYARLIVFDGQSAYYVRMFDTLRGLDPTVYFTPGDQGYLLFAKDAGKRKNRWERRIPVRVRAMVLTPGRLLTAGPPDVVDAADPLGAFEGRKGGVLQMFDTASGEPVAQQQIASPPVFNGMAAAAGRLYLTAEDGSITCFGRPAQHADR